MITRRQAIKTTAFAGAALAAAPALLAQTNYAPTTAAPAAEPFTLPKLPYPYDALEPQIDAQTMQIHHDRHHKAYVDNLNKIALDIGKTAFQGIDNLIVYLNLIKDEKLRAAARNNGGGHYNHSLFWQMMKPGGSSDPTGDLDNAINNSFGSLNAFKTKFTEAASKIFGSGWAWLVLDGKELKIETTPNQDSPLTASVHMNQNPPLSAGRQVLLGLDVWEHAYYLKFQNRRADYIAAWWKVVNWNFVAERYAKLKA
jgi:superoxide dismutase, Fe-Mn family